MWALLQTTGSIDAALLQYGALGIVAALAMLAVRVLFKRETEAHDRERARAERLEVELRELNAAIRDKYIVALGDASRAVSDAMMQLREK